MLMEDGDEIDASIDCRRWKFCGKMKIDAELRVKYHPLVYDEEDNFSTVTVSCYSSSGHGIAQYCDDQ